MASETTSDLAKLDVLDEKTIITELGKRYAAGDIYTYVGDIILAVNPFQAVPLYTEEVRRKYLGGTRDEKPPHLYHLAFDGYEAMLRTKTSQSFVISGESGAGKSESTKHIVNHVIELCKAGKKSLEQRIQDLNPLLEAFGNAKTVMNNNSSRFGKFIEIKFTLTGAVMGAELSEYLLEKSRVARQSEGELNYHVFYYLIAGLPQCSLFSYDLGAASSHAYLRSPGAPSDAAIACADNVGSFNELVATLEKMGFEDDDVCDMLKILAAILLVGDTTFEEGANDAAKITSDVGKLKEAARLLQCDFGELQQSMLTFTSKVGSEKIVRTYSVDTAIGNRDAFATAFYARLFGWIVTCCNTLLIDPEAASETFVSLGILDIFGFENFKFNTLEQLCINITNERLHTFFNEFIFSAELAEYEAEGIGGASFVYVDNQPTLDLLLKKPGGLLHLLDEETRFPKATDGTFTEKVSNLASHSSNALTPAKAARDLSFTITHYAGDVIYSTLNFLEKNRDELSKDVTQALKFSQGNLVAALWTAKTTGTGTFRVTRGSMRPKTAKRAVKSICTHFTTSLADLLKKISASKPHFVRCLKPNTEKVPKKFDEELMVRQLQYAGVLETVKIRKLGFAVRERFDTFAKRYRSLAFPGGMEVPNTAESCKTILAAAGIEGWAIGKSKVFLKYFHVEQLAALRRKSADAKRFVEKVVRGFIARARYRKIKAQMLILFAAVTEMFGAAEEAIESVRAKMIGVNERDVKAAAERKFVAEIKAKREAEEKAAKEAEAIRLEKLAALEAKEAAEEAERAAAAEKARTLKRMKKFESGGGFDRSKTDQLTIRVGPLAKHWEKKVDKATGRTYFKNHKTRQTTWIDPRTEFTRKKNAAATEGDELPYGWDEAEINGEKYFIDHVNQQTHWLHPRLLMEEMREQYKEREENTQSRAQQLRTDLKSHRDKRLRLEQQKENAANDEEIITLDERIGAQDAVIEEAQAQLKAVLGENQTLKKELKTLYTQFEKAKHELGGAAKGTFDESDVQDLYPVFKGSSDTLPGKLNTLKKKELKIMAAAVKAAAGVE